VPQCIKKEKKQRYKNQILYPHAGAEAGNNADPSHQNPENHLTTVSLTVCAMHQYPVKLSHPAVKLCKT